MTEKSMDTILREIRDTFGKEMLANGVRLMAAFCDLSSVKRDQRLLRYFVEADGHKAFLNAEKLSSAMQQTCRQQMIRKLCDDMLIGQEAAQYVCTAFWTALYGTATTSKPQMQTAWDSFELDPDLEIDGDTVVQYKGNKAHVRIPTGIVTIGKDAFLFNKNLTSVELPEGLQTIGKSAFHGTGLREVRLPDSLQTIDTWGFNDTHLESVILPLGLKEASAWSFGSCKKLRKVEFRHMPKRLHPFMFSNSDSLEEVVFPEGTERVDLDDFRHGKAFMRIHIPDSVNDIHCFLAEDEQKFEIIASQKWIAAHQKLFIDNPNCTPVPSEK